MPSLDTLPSEIILTIATHLLPSQLLHFSQANSHMHQITTTLIQPFLIYHKNRTEMRRRFGIPNICVGKPSPRHKVCMASNLDQLDVFEGPEQETIRDLEYLYLNGDLNWVDPLPKEIMEQHEWHQGDAAAPSEIAIIRDTAKRMNVELPAAFIAFISSQECINSMFLGGEYFSLTPKLVECLGCDDKEGGGFIVVFMRDQQDCGFTGLYIAPGGYHCVLGLGEDFFDYSFSEDLGCDNDEVDGQTLKEQEVDSARDKNLPEDKTVSQHDGEAERFISEGKRRRRHSPVSYRDVPLAKQSDYFLLHTDIEEWLVMRYFDMWIGKTWEDICEEEEGREFSSSQMEYLRNCWAAE